MTSATPPSEARRASGPAILGRWKVPFFYGWVIVAVCYFADFFASGLGGTVTLFFTPMKDELGWSLSQLVGATTAATIGGIFVSPFLGRAIDRFGVKPVMLWGTIVGGVGMILLIFVREVWQFWLLYACVAGLGLAEFSGLASQSAVAKWFVQRRGRALTFSTLGQTMGNIAFAPVVAFIITLLGWRSAWGVTGLILLLFMLPLVIVLIHNRPEDVGLVPDGEWKPKGQEGTKAPVLGEISWTLREALRTRSLWALMGTFVIGGSTMSMMTTLAPYLSLTHHMSGQAVGWVITGFWIPATGSRLIWGYLIDKWPARLCLFICSLGRGVGVLSLALAPYPLNIGLWWLFSGLVGNSFGILQPIMFANYFGRRSFATIQGGVRPLMALPGLVFPLVIARLFDISGSFTAAFLFAGSLGFIGAAASIFAAAPVKREEPGAKT